MSKILTVVESNNNHYPVYYNIYNSLYECKKIEYQKYKNKKCKLEQQLADITKEIKEAKNKMFVYNSIIILINLYKFNCV